MEFLISHQTAALEFKLSQYWDYILMCISITMKSRNVHLVDGFTTASHTVLNPQSNTAPRSIESQEYGLLSPH